MRFETAIGTCGVEWSERGLTGVSLLDPGAPTHEDAPAWVHEAVSGIVALLAGERRDLRAVPVDETRVDEFGRRVYAATREVGPGETATYGEIARAIGEPGASRAVGAALGANPFPIVVPCHRILAATGALHGFSAPGGVRTKRRMLEIERAPGFVQISLFA